MSHLPHQIKTSPFIGGEVQRHGIEKGSEVRGLVAAALKHKLKIKHFIPGVRATESASRGASPGSANCSIQPAAPGPFGRREHR